jgi:dTDP-L-rhamnose 4-epimerase
MKCLILGGAGFIGRRTALKLLEAGHSVRILDVFDPQIHGDDLAVSDLWAALQGRAKIAVGDARDPVAVGRGVAEADTVFYFAAGTGTGQSMYQVRHYTEVNVQGAAVLAEELARHRAQIRRVVVSSSRAVYGEGAYVCATHGRVFPRSRKLADLECARFDPPCPVCGAALTAAPSFESDPVQPGSIYGITKYAQEQLILNTCEAIGVPAVALRYQNVYGPGQSLKNPYTGILSIFSQLLLQDRPINVFEDGKPTRDFVFVDDVAEFNVRAAERALTENHILNVGTGVRQSLLDVVTALANAYGRTPDYKVSGQFRVGDIRHAVADTSRLFAVLGGHTFVGFQEGINRFAAWVRQQSLETDANARYQKSLQEMTALGLFRTGAVAAR